MSIRGFTWTPLSFINDAADKLGFGQLFSHFLIYYFVLLFLHLLVSFFFLFLVFHPVLAWRSQKLSIAIVAKHVFFLFGYVWKWGDLFSLQRNHFGVKKGHFMLRHTHLLILFWTCVFVASMLCWLAPSKTYPTEIYRFTLDFSTKGFTLAQKITSDPHIWKENDIHHNEETFEKLFAKKNM